MFGGLFQYARATCACVCVGGGVSACVTHIHTYTYASTHKLTSTHTHARTHSRIHRRALTDAREDRGQWVTRLSIFICFCFYFLLCVCCVEQIMPDNYSSTHFYPCVQNQQTRELISTRN